MFMTIKYTQWLSVKEMSRDSKMIARCVITKNKVRVRDFTRLLVKE